MSERGVNILLAVLLAVILLLTLAMRRDPTQPWYQFIPEMHYSVPYNPQSENPNFEDGMTARTPVAGTIVRGMMPLHYEATPEEARRAGRELANPFGRENTAAQTRGAAVYSTFCQPCHGPRGLGDGPVTRYGFPPPPSLLAENARRMADGQVFHIITYGQGNMPSLASQVAREDRWKVTLYVRALQERGAEQQAAPPPPGGTGLP